MATLWRNTPPGVPFLWEVDNARPARWHGTGEGPAQYFADTPAGAWAELLRHEEIVDPADVAGLARDLWAVEVPDREVAAATLIDGPSDVLLGGPRTYAACQRLAATARAKGAEAVVAPSAALAAGAAAGWRVDGGLVRADDADGRVVVLYGRRPGLVGQRAVDAGQPPADLVGDVRPLYGRAKRARKRATGPAGPVTGGG